MLFVTDNWPGGFRLNISEIGQDIRNGEPEMYPRLVDFDKTVYESGTILEDDFLLYMNKGDGMMYVGLSLMKLTKKTLRVKAFAPYYWDTQRQLQTPVFAEESKKIKAKYVHSDYIFARIMEHNVAYIEKTADGHERIQLSARALSRYRQFNMEIITTHYPLWNVLEPDEEVADTDC